MFNTKQLQFIRDTMTGNDFTTSPKYHDEIIDMINEELWEAPDPTVQVIFHFRDELEQPENENWKIVGYWDCAIYPWQADGNYEGIATLHNELFWCDERVMSRDEMRKIHQKYEDYGQRVHKFFNYAHLNDQYVPTTDRDAFED